MPDKERESKRLQDLSKEELIGIVKEGRLLYSQYVADNLVLERKNEQLKLILTTVQDVMNDSCREIDSFLKS